MKTRNIIATLIIFLVILIGVTFIYFQKSGKKEIKELTTDEILNEAKTITMMDLNIIPEIVRWNTQDKEKTLDGKGFFYVDRFKSQKVTDIFNNLNNFLKKEGFVNDEYNQDINDERNILKKYKKNEIVCNLSIIDNNSNQTSTVKMACAEEKKLIYNFTSEEGKKCVQDSDCEIFLDACAKATVCRNKNYKFYNDCENPSSLVKDIDFTVAKCQCVENQCIAKRNQNEE